MRSDTDPGRLQWLPIRFFACKNFAATGGIKILPMSFLPTGEQVAVRKTVIHKIAEKRAGERNFAGENFPR